MTNKKTILDYDTVHMNTENGGLVIIDQTKLPYETSIIELTEIEDIWDAIYELKVRGAPAIGVAAAIGASLVASKIEADNFDDFYKDYKKGIDYLATSRPTAVNLFWALNRMDQKALDNRERPVAEIKEILKKEALEIREEDIRVSEKIGEYGLDLIEDGYGLLTHCNAGQLATVKYGTATAPMYFAHEKGYKIRVFTDETRPLLQGARLTSYELHSAGIDTTVITDNMAAMVMKNGWVDAVFVGCDRVAANGDAANKIGTLGVAILAKRYNIPFYICAPTSTIDMECETGKDIVIEERPKEEVTEMWYENRMAPEGVNVYNPAFDVTDHDLITGIVTEYGVLRPPYDQALKEIFDKYKK